LEHGLRGATLLAYEGPCSKAHREPKAFLDLGGGTLSPPSDAGRTAIKECPYVSLAVRWNTVVMTADEKLRKKTMGTERGTRIVMLADAEQLVGR
jgi:hypothetical protein